jgi:hypothetical protein
VLEVGACDVNGSVRPFVETHGPASYIGVDQAAGPRVDRVLPCARLVAEFGAGRFDVVISTEMLEHVEDWAGSVAQLCEMVRAGGVLVVTTRSPGFRYHPYPIDCWRFSVDAMLRIVDRAGFEADMVIPDPDPDAPGVFCVARKPVGWASPWSRRPPGKVFSDVGVAPVQAAAASSADD